MNITVILDGGAGELDRKSFHIGNNADDEKVSDAIKDAMSMWTLSPGDTIRVLDDAE